MNIKKSIQNAACFWILFFTSNLNEIYYMLFTETCNKIYVQFKIEVDEFQEQLFKEAET